MPDSLPPQADLSWCFSSLGCPDFSLSEIASLARRFDIRQVELRAVSERLDLPALFTENFGDASTMKAWLADEGIAISSLDSSAKLAGGSEAAKEELLAFADWATALDIPAIRVFDGGAFRTELDPAFIEEAAAFLSSWQAEKASNNWTVDLIIETHDALCTAAHCLKLAEEVDSPVHILWDSHHTWRKAGEDPIKSWKEMKHLIRHIHFKDSVDQPSARHPFTYTHLGEGEFDLGSLFRTLREDKFAGSMSLEWEKKWHPYLDPIDQALSKLDSWRLDRP